jgi:hypothetical protein
LRASSQVCSDFYLSLKDNQWHLTQKQDAEENQVKLPKGHVIVVAYNDILRTSADTTASDSPQPKYSSAIPFSLNSFFDAPGGTSPEESGSGDLQKKHGWSFT